MIMNSACEEIAEKEKPTCKTSFQDMIANQNKR